MIYPKWVYHKTLDPKVVQTKEEHEALGKDWKNSPADFEEKTPEPTGSPEAPKDEAPVGSGDLVTEELGPEGQKVLKPKKSKKTKEA